MKFNHSNNHKRQLLKLALILLTLLLLIRLPSAPLIAAGAEQAPKAKLELESASNNQVNSGKTEVVYALLDAKGNAGDLYVVNHFELAEKGEIKDYGGYDEIVWLTGNEPLQTDDEIKIFAKAGNYYYEGILRDRQLPWFFELEWYLNDKRIDDPAELSGAKGELKIVISSRPNPAANQGFADNYSLQIALSLPRFAVTGVQAEDATIAEAGNNTLVNFVVLPGYDASCVVRAYVEDFYMPAISISAVKLDMSFKMPDVSDMNDDMGKLIDAVSELKEGTDKLKDGSQELKDGLGEIIEGVATLGTEGDKLAAGIDEATGGIESFAGGMSLYLAAVSDYVAGVKGFGDGVGTLADGATKLDSGVSELASGMNELASSNNDLLQGSGQIKAALEQISAGLASGTNMPMPTPGQLAELDQLLAGSTAFKAGLNALIGGLKQSSAGLGQINTQLSSAIGSKMSDQEWIGLLNNTAQAAGASINFGTFFNNNPAEAGIILAVLGGQQDQTIALLTGLTAQLGQLKSGQDDIISGLEDLAENFDQIDQGLKSLTDMIKAYSGDLAKLPELIAGIKQLSDQYNTFHQGLAQYSGAVAEIAAGIASKDPNKPGVQAGLGQLVSGLEKLDGAGAELNKGGDRLTAAGSEVGKGSDEIASGFAELNEGAKAYVQGVKDLGAGLREYESGLEEYSDGMKELAAGVSEFEEETRDLDDKLLDEINDKIDEFLHKDFVPNSFVSPKNKEVEAVQFVFLTEEIPEAEKPVVEVPQEEEKDFWGRVKAIFGA